MTYVVGLICMIVFNCFLAIATDHMVRSYQKKAERRLMWKNSAVFWPISLC